MDRSNISKRYQEVQDFICAELEKLDGLARFKEDLWSREGGGGGRTRVISGGDLIEKGGVNFSEVLGDVTPLMRKEMGIEAEQFFACGVSIVLHPKNPHVPIIHMNIRYFELSNGTYWFGGGIDLTPHYVVESKAKDFHLALKAICDQYHPTYYPKFKSWADDYFFIPHRNETRGVGGVFFDHLKENESISKEQIFDFCVDLGMSFPEIYAEQVDNRNLDYTSEQKRWQHLRRGRYVEFNLVNDRGTKFGLVSNGRTESILMSLPPMAEWEYQFVPKSGSREEQTLNLLKRGKDWIKSV